MTIQLRAASSNTGGTGKATTITPTLPVGWQAGELIFVVGRIGTASGTWSQTAGDGVWSIDQTSNGSTGGYSSFVATRVMNGTEVVAPTFTCTAAQGTWAWAAIALYSDTSAVLSVDVYATKLDAATAATSFTPNAATASGTNEASVIATVARATTTGTGSPTYTKPTNWTSPANGTGALAGSTNTNMGIAAVAYQLGLGPGSIAPTAETVVYSSKVFYASVYHALVKESTRVTPSTVTAASTITAPAVSTDSVQSPAAVSGSALIPVPAIATEVVPAPVSVDAVSLIPLPTIASGGSASINANTVSGLSTIPTPTLEVGATFSPVSVLGTSTVPLPSVLLSSSITTNVINGIATIPTPAVTAGGGQTISPSAVLGMATIPLPTVQLGIIAAPASILAQTVIAQPGIVLGVALTPSTVSALASIPGPYVSAQGHAAVQPSAVIGQSSIPVALVSLSIVTNPASVLASTVTPPPQLLITSLASPAAVTGIVIINAPVIPEQLGFGTSHVSGQSVGPASLSGQVLDSSLLIVPIFSVRVTGKSH